MKTSVLMKQQGLRYFSSLTAKQKDETIFFILKAKLGLLKLPPTLVKTIMVNIFDEVVQVRELIYEKVKNQKCFKHNGVYYPMNIQEIIKN